MELWKIEANHRGEWVATMHVMYRNELVQTGDTFTSNDLELTQRWLERRGLQQITGCNCGKCVALLEQQAIEVWADLGQLTEYAAASR